MLASGPQSALASAGAGDQACRRGLPERSVGKPVTRSWPGGGGVSPEDALSNIFAKLGSRHPDEDICDMYAGADLYGLGAGVYPKDRVPDCPVHPNCLCHLTPIYESELQGKHRSDNVEENGDAWLEKQPLHVRQSILGVRGEKEWQEGRLSWTEKAETLDVADSYCYFGTDIGRIDKLVNYVRKALEMEYNTIIDLEDVPRIQGSPSLEEIIEGVNPNYSRHQAYRANCQKCVPTLELRQRGYDVTAKWRDSSSLSDLEYTLVRNPFVAFKDATVVQCKSALDNGKAEIEKQLQIWGAGSRVEIAVYDAKKGGRVFSAVNNNNTIIFIDAQDNNLRAEKLFENRKLTTHFARIDTLQINPDYLNIICEWRPKK